MNVRRALFNGAVWRLVRRGLSRNKGRTFALFMLTLLPVLAASAVTLVFAEESQTLPPERSFGTADAWVTGLSDEEVAERFPGAETATWSELHMDFGNDTWTIADPLLNNPLLDGIGQGEVVWVDLLLSLIHI